MLHQLLRLYGIGFVVLWVVAPRSVVVRYRCFRGLCYVHQKGWSVGLIKVLSLHHTWKTEENREKFQSGHPIPSLQVRCIITCTRLHAIRLPLIATPFLLIDVIAYSRSSLLSLLGSIWTSSKSTGTPAYLTNSIYIIIYTWLMRVYPKVSGLSQ